MIFSTDPDAIGQASAEYVFQEQEDQEGTVVVSSHGGEERCH
jgi:hypothetical protein